MSKADELLGGGSVLGQLAAQGQQRENPMIAYLEAMILAVRAGQVRSMAIICSGGPGTYKVDILGPDVLEMSFGLDEAKDSIKAAVRQAGERKSPIIKVRTGG